MGTSYSVKIALTEDAPDIDAVVLKNKIDSVLVEVNNQMSTYIPESEISRFNRYDKTDWFNISNDFAFVLDESIKLGKLTGGSLDITIGPVVNIWGFGPDQRPRTVPSDDEIITNMKLVGIDNLEVKLDPPSVRKKITGIKVDLSATAKGYGVDKVLELLKELGYKNIMVEIGGEVRTLGYNNKNEFWNIGISSPNQSGEINRVVKLSNSAMATSGDYWNYFEENGLRYSHTIDPITGRPITHKLASVTIFDSTCLRADGLATGIFVMGPEKGYDFAVRMELPVYLIVKTDNGFKEIKSPKFIELFEK
jgi:thiamine biosynthesis lipoprotein